MSIAANDRDQQLWIAQVRASGDQWVPWCLGLLRNCKCDDDRAAVVAEKVIPFLEHQHGPMSPDWGNNARRAVKRIYEHAERAARKRQAPDERTAAALILLDSEIEHRRQRRRLIAEKINHRGDGPVMFSDLLKLECSEPEQNKMILKYVREVTSCDAIMNAGPVIVESMQTEERELQHILATSGSHDEQDKQDENKEQKEQRGQREQREQKEQREHKEQKEQGEKREQKEQKQKHSTT
eukprot:m51a1_g1460 putative dynein heavy chain (239) ;mRNA; r:208810-209655